MNRTRIVRTVIVPTLIALLATLGLYTALSSRLSAPERIPVVMGQVVTATTSIPSRTVITRDMVTLKDVPLAFVTPGTVRTVEAVVGRIALVPLASGEILMGNNVTGTVQGTAGLSYAVTPGKRAMTVQVDEISGVAGFPLVGDHVDILWTTVGQAMAQQTENRTRLLLEDLPILAVVQNLSLSSDSGAARDLKGYTSVTVEVTPEQAATIALAESYGRIRMLLRPAVDAQSVGEFELRGTALLQASRTLALAGDKRIGLEVRVLELDVSALASLGFSQSQRGLERLASWQLNQLSSLIENGRGRVLERSTLSAANRVGLTYRWMAQAAPSGTPPDAYPAPYGLSVDMLPAYYGQAHAIVEASVRLQMVDVPADGRSLTGSALSVWGSQRPQMGEGVIALGLVSADALQPAAAGAKRMVLPGNVSADLLSGKRTLMVVIVPSF
ncbi:MAG: Flp pilus assembly protein CpaB [Bacillota bacterium]|nr:Flp pilus assembly protein CpaB [Bacillota bacterium]